MSRFPWSWGTMGPSSSFVLIQWLLFGVNFSRVFVCLWLSSDNIPLPKHSICSHFGVTFNVTVSRCVSPVSLILGKNRVNPPWSSTRSVKSMFRYTLFSFTHAFVTATKMLLLLIMCYRWLCPRLKLSSHQVTPEAAVVVGVFCCDADYHAVGDFAVMCNGWT